MTGLQSKVETTRVARQPVRSTIPAFARPSAIRRPRCRTRRWYHHRSVLRCGRCFKKEEDVQRRRCVVRGATVVARQLKQRGNQAVLLEASGFFL